MSCGGRARRWRGLPTGLLLAFSSKGSSQEPGGRQPIVARCWTAAPGMNSSSQPASGGTGPPASHLPPPQAASPSQLPLPLAGQKDVTIKLHRSVRCYLCVCPGTLSGEALPSGTTLPRGCVPRRSRPRRRARVLGLGTVLSASRCWFTACLPSCSRMPKRVSGNTNRRASFAACAGPGRSGEEAGGCRTTFFFVLFSPLLI